MPAVYLAGPLSDGDDPFAWHNAIRRSYPSVEWVNPFELNEHGSEEEARAHIDEVIQKDLEAVKAADAVLLRRISGYNLCGASIEAREAYVNNIPVVVWNTGEGKTPIFLEGHAEAVYDSRENAIQAVIRTAREVVDSSNSTSSD